MANEKNHEPEDLAEGVKEIKRDSTDLLLELHAAGLNSRKIPWEAVSSDSSPWREGLSNLFAHTLGAKAGAVNAIFHEHQTYGIGFCTAFLEVPADLIGDRGEQIAPFVEAYRAFCTAWALGEGKVIFAPARDRKAEESGS